MQLIRIIAVFGVFVFACASVAAAATVFSGFGSLPYAVTLKYHHAADLETLIENQTDPSSPVYGKFLTPDEFRRYFAPTPAEYATTVAQLDRAGFRVTGTSPNRTIIDVSAPASLVAHTFAYASPTGGRTGSTPFGGMHRLIASSAFPYVDGIVGGDAPPRGSAVRSRLAIRGAASAMRYGYRDHDNEGRLAHAVGPDGGYGPAALIKGLNFPGRHGYDGSGVAVADIVDGHPVDADVQTFLNGFGIRRTGPPTAIISVDGGNGPDPDLADIDTEWIVGTAPGVRLYIYEMAVFAGTFFVDALNKIVSDNIADVANTSLSTCESDTPNLALAIQPILKQGAAQGIAFEVPSFGNYTQCPIPDTLFPIVPADSQDVLAVSGTNAITDADGEIVAETAQHMAGGGVSAIVESFPAQRRIRGVDPTGRNTPDISIASEINGNGSSAFFSGGWFGGYLLPNFVNNIPSSSLLAEYQQMSHHRLGAFNRTLYHIFARHGYGDGIIDITAGCDGVYVGGPICAKRGYDITTGIGAISDAYRLGRSLRR